MQQFAIFRVPDERQIAAKHAAVVLRIFDGDRLMHRSARGETDETRDVHARQGLRDRSRGGDESDAGLAGGHGVVPSARSGLAHSISSRSYASTISSMAMSVPLAFIGPEVCLMMRAFNSLQVCTTALWSSFCNWMVTLRMAF